MPIEIRKKEAKKEQKTKKKKNLKAKENKEKMKLALFGGGILQKKRK